MLYPKIDEPTVKEIKLFVADADFNLWCLKRSLNLSVSMLYNHLQTPFNTITCLLYVPIVAIHVVILLRLQENILPILWD